MGRVEKFQKDVDFGLKISIMILTVYKILLNKSANIIKIIKTEKEKNYEKLDSSRSDQVYR